MLQRIGMTPLALWLMFPLLAAAELDRGDLEFFEKKIRPVLVEHCYECHSSVARESKKLKGGLLLDTRNGLRAGGESGLAIVPGQPGKSLLMTALRGNGDAVVMPPKGKLSDTVIADFEKWIQSGAPDPRDEVAASTTTDFMEL